MEYEDQLENISNTFKAELGEDDFKNYILGFISYKYLSEKMEYYADVILQSIGESYVADCEYDVADPTIREAALESLGYFLKPSELFSELVHRGNADGKGEFILDDLTKILNSVAQDTTGAESKEDFDHHFKGLDLTTSKLGKDAKSNNDFIVKVLSHLDEIDLIVDDYDADILSGVYEYLND